MAEQYKRNIAYKLRIGQILSGKPVFEADRLKSLDLDGKQIVRVNIIANVIEKYIQEGEKKYASLTLDDGSGQIQVKFFGDEIEKTKDYNQGDTVLVVGLLRSWNNQIYLTSDIIKKKEPSYLLVRKLEIDSEFKGLDKTQMVALKDKLIDMIKKAEPEDGLDTEKAIMELKEPPEAIKSEIKKLLEEGLIYEPRPNKLRWLG